MLTRRTHTALRLRLFGAAAVLALPAGLHAQAAAPASQAAFQGPAPIEEVHVTARRRSERLQKVPVAVTVISGRQAKQQNLVTLEDITSEVPSADFRTSSSNKDRTIFIRGIGTISTSPGVEPSVSTIVDGVVLARAGQATEDLLGLDQIEVLRGAQGTLFGKNASAGAVNITTVNPTKDLHSYVDAGYFSGGDEYRLEGGVSGTLAPDLTGVLTAQFGHYDGNVKNVFTGKDVNGYQREGFRTKLQYQPSDDLKATLELDYLKTLDTVPNGIFVATGRRAYPTGILTPNPSLATQLAAEGITPNRNNTQISNNLTSDANDDNGGAALTIEKSLGDYTLTSITAYRYWENVQRQDYDQFSVLTPATPQLADRGNLAFQQFSQELRIASPKGGFLDYQAGIYYLNAQDDEEYDRALETTTKTGLTHDYSGVARYGTTGNDVALFGEANLNFTPDFRAVLGVRGISDTLSYNFDRISSSPVVETAIRAGFTSRGSDSVLDYSDRAGLQYDILPDIMAYFTYSRGYKGPAYNVFFNMNDVNPLDNPTHAPIANDTQVLKQETSNNFEIGLKSEFLQDRVQLNIDGFIENFRDYQANFADEVAGAIVTRLINAGQVTSRGFEGDMTIHPLRNLELNELFSYDDAHVVRFACPPGAATTCDINGGVLPFAPRIKLDSRARYTIPLNDHYDVALNTDFSWQTKTQYQLTETPDTIQKAYGIWNAGITLAQLDQGWRVTGLVKNILDTHYASYVVYGNLGGVVDYIPRDFRRYYGLELHKDF